MKFNTKKPRVQNIIQRQLTLDDKNPNKQTTNSSIMTKHFEILK